MNRVVKTVLKKIFINIGGVWMIRKCNKTPRILFWHGVDDIMDQEVEAESFTVDDFIKQLDYLNKNFEIISLDEFYNRFITSSFTNKEIVLTFDDGYANNLYKVAPILNNLDLPFTVFISTEHIEKGELFPTSIARLIILGSELSSLSIPLLNIKNEDISIAINKRLIYSYVSKELKIRTLKEVRTIIEQLKSNLLDFEYYNLVDKYKSVRPMTWEEVKELHKLGATIGSHCKYHICCHKNQELREVKSQLMESKKIIEEILKIECKYFAYPNGDYTAESNNIVLEAGYMMGFSTNCYKRIENSKEIAIMPRIGVQRNFDTFRIHTSIYPKR